ncbi:MAG: TonB-dependent receptor [Myxococcota bacterium]
MWPGLLGPALAGVTLDTSGWPDDVTPPELSGCPEVVWPVGISGDPFEARVHALLRADGSLAEGRIDSPRPDLDDALTEALAGCGVRAAVFQGEPADVPVTFVIDVPPPPLSLTVTVKLRGEGITLPGFTVVVGGQSAVTNDDGVAELRNLAPGDAPVTTGDPRYRIASAPTLPVSDTPRSADVWVAEDEGWEIVARYSKETDRPGTHTITQEEIRITPGSLSDPVRGVSARPGMVRTPFDSGWLLVRGGDPGDTGLYLDGVRIPLLYHLGGFTSAVHPQMVEEVRFWPGSTPARYGRQLAGAVDVVPRELGDRAQIVAGANLAFAHAFVEIPTKGGGFAAAFRRSYLDAALTLAVGAERARIAPRFWDVQARITGERYSLMFLGLSDSIDAPTGTNTNTVEIQQRAGQLQGRLDIPVRNLKLRISPWVANWLRGIDGSAEPQSTVEFFPGARIELSPADTTAVRWRAGIEGEYRTYAITQGTVARRRPAQLVDPYLDARIGKGLQADLGIRAESLFVEGQLPRAELSPRGSLRWAATDWLTVSAEAGRSHKPPEGALLIGLPDGAYLDLERADSAGVGFVAKRGIATLESNVWTRRMSRLAGFERDNSVGGLFGRADGIENQLSVVWPDLSVRAIYQYTRSTRWEDPGGELERNPTPWDQPHRVQIVALGQLPRDWALSGRMRYSSGFPAPRDTTTAYDLLTDESVELGPELGRLQPFASLDVKISHRFLFRSWQVDAYLDLENIGPRVFEPIITGFDDTDPAYSKGLPFLPVFGFDGVFWPGRATSRDR